MSAQTAGGRFVDVRLYLRLAKKAVGSKGARKVSRMIWQKKKRFERELRIPMAPEVRE